MASRSLPSRSVVVTGASSGIGEAITLELAAHGFRVFAGVRRSDDGDRLARRGRGAVEPLFLDVTDPEALSSASAKVAERTDGLGLFGLVNNAGIVVFG